MKLKEGAGMCRSRREAQIEGDRGPSRTHVGHMSSVETIDAAVAGAIAGLDWVAGHMSSGT